MALYILSEDLFSSLPKEAQAMIADEGDMVEDEGLIAQIDELLDGVSEDGEEEKPGIPGKGMFPKKPIDDDEVEEMFKR